ncbi:rhomboid protease [Malassezia nana]|uniref:Rhomboid protease n=1 Tax=Malassezia nana TaxID=180528 RepID=A0AAF0EJ54_9BASI|nr:rhomboid protease [Malassezia nana]
MLFGSRSDLCRAAQQDQAEQLYHGMQWLDGLLQYMPQSVRECGLQIYVSVSRSLLSLPAYQQSALPILAIETMVLGTWLLAPRLGTMRWMMRSFTHRPASGRVLTLFTSVFSHRSLVHFALNNLALWSVGSSAILGLTGMPPEASSLPHFLAFFVTAGLCASLASHLALALRWRLARTRFDQALLWRRASLGASGAIYAAFALSACVMPQVHVSLLFLPMVAFPIQWGLGALLFVDMVGVYRGWKVFDHVAHLGGAAFGLAYYAVGPTLWTWWTSQWLVYT